jgi:hypothetical protein
LKRNPEKDPEKYDDDDIPQMRKVVAVSVARLFTIPG